MKFTAEMQHTKESIHRLSAVQHHAFLSGIRLFWSGCGVACIWGAVAVSDQFLLYILLFCGIWLLLNLELPAKHQADKLIKLSGGELPYTKYRFEEDKIHVSSGDYQKNISYGQLYALLEDKSYYFLFLNRNAGFMVDKNQVSSKTPEELKAFLEAKTGRRFRKTTGAGLSIPALFKKSG